MKHPKPIDCTEVQRRVENGEWRRVQAGREGLLPGVRAAPGTVHTTLSGSMESPRYEHKHGVRGNVVAAQDVQRFDQSDYPYLFNKDHYFVTKDENGQCWLHGPFRKGEADHHVREIPEEYWKNVDFEEFEVA